MDEENAPLAGQVAFVTGASKGIGKAIAIGLAEAGATVALTGRAEGTGPGTAGETALEVQAVGGTALPLLCDVRDEAQVQAAIAACVSEFGRLDVVVNNAGLFWPGETVESTSLERWDETIATHIRGPFLCSRYAIPHLSRHGGSIINMSSTAGDPTYGGGRLISYAVGKAGMEQLTRGLAIELYDRNISVNAIRPMSLLTDSAAKHTKDPERLANFVPPAAINPAIVHLAQCRTEFTGNVVNRTDFVDGHFATVVAPGVKLPERT